MLNLVSLTNNYSTKTIGDEQYENDSTKSNELKNNKSSESNDIVMKNQVNERDYKANNLNIEHKKPNLQIINKSNIVESFSYCSSPIVLVE